jgi:hypothetical protein
MEEADIPPQTPANPPKSDKSATPDGTPAVNHTSVNGASGTPDSRMPPRPSNQQERFLAIRLVFHSNLQ